VQKALVVLRVNLDALYRRQGALTFADVQCVGSLSKNRLTKLAVFSDFRYPFTAS
jgi:hypothetical protein